MPYENQSPLYLTIEQEPHPEYWHAKVQGLEEAVCFLLRKNQEMRMALTDQKGNFQIKEPS